MNPIHEAEAMDEASSNGGLMERLRRRVDIMAQSPDERTRSESAALEAILLEEAEGRTVPDMSWRSSPAAVPRKRKARVRAGAKQKRKDWWSAWKDGLP